MKFKNVKKGMRVKIKDVKELYVYDYNFGRRGYLDDFKNMKGKVRHIDPEYETLNVHVMLDNNMEVWFNHKWLKRIKK